jgi:hypothetical protein
LEKGGKRANYFHGKTSAQFSPRKREPMTVKMRAPMMKRVKRTVKTFRFSPPIKRLFKKGPHFVLGFLSI